MTAFADLSTQAQLEKSHQLTHAITQALTQFIAEANPFILFNGLLDNLLTLTDSEYGFIGEVFYDDHGQPYIQSYATTNIAWSEATQKLYTETEQQGMKFSRLNSLYGQVLKTGQHVIANDPANDSRSGGLPKGHPPLNKFLGIPFFNHDSLLGVVGIANRESGYDEALVDYLSPFLVCCGNLIQAYRNTQQKQRMERELQSYKKRVAALQERLNNTACTSTSSPTTTEEDHIQLCSEFSYHLTTKTLINQNTVIPLTNKESLLLDLLIQNRNKVVSYQDIEAYVWGEIIVSESSLRALMLRLRKKLPNLPLQTISGVGVLLSA